LEPDIVNQSNNYLEGIFTMYIKYFKIGLSLWIKKHLLKIKILAAAVLFLGFYVAPAAYAADSQDYTVNLTAGTAYENYVFIPGQLCLSGPGATGISWSPNPPDISQIHLLDTYSNPYLSGTPTITGTWVYNFSCLDSSTGNITAPSAPPAAVKPIKVKSLRVKKLAVGKIGKTYSKLIKVLHDRKHLAWSIISGSLPKGMRLDPSSGIILGTPEKIGDYSFRIEAQNENTIIFAKDFSLEIKK
jgi:hypothetical protein